MIRRITSILIAAAVCGHAIAGSGPGHSSMRDAAVAGTMFEIDLPENIVTVDKNGDVINRRLLGIAAFHAFSPAVALAGELRHVLDYQRCEQAIVLRVAACSMRRGTATYECAYLPLDTELYKGPGGCEL